MTAGTASDIVLRATGLTKSYRDVTAVDDLSFDVRRGEILGFLGPNGAGKTTTLKMMCGLLRPDAGRVEVDGRAIHPHGSRALCRVGVSPQSIVIWETLTCREQMEFAGRLYGMTRADARRQSRTLLEAFGLAEKADRLGRTLSGGMQRRLNIALALVHGPAILFLDEPQAGLDPQSRVLVRDYLTSMAGRTTVVVTTHDMDEADRLSDRVCIIDRGRLLALDTVASIKDLLGSGDFVEIDVVGPETHELEVFAAGLQGRLPSLSAQGRTLRFRSADAGSDIPGALGAIRGRGWTLRRMRTRQRTLEDVFIHLTGRALRE